MQMHDRWSTQLSRQSVSPPCRGACAKLIIDGYQLTGQLTSAIYMQLISLNANNFREPSTT